MLSARPRATTAAGSPSSPTPARARRARRPPSRPRASPAPWPRAGSRRVTSTRRRSAWSSTAAGVAAERGARRGLRQRLGLHRAVALRERPAGGDCALGPGAPAAGRRRASGQGGEELMREGGGVLVTGAANGIGRATAARLAEAGARVCAVDREQAPAPPNGHAIVADLAELGALADLVAEAERAVGPLDALVNVAGIWEPQSILELSPGALRESLAVNLEAPMLLAAAAARGMAGRGYGRIVSVTSVHARVSALRGSGLRRVEGRSRGGHAHAGNRAGPSRGARKRRGAGLRGHAHVGRRGAGHTGDRALPPRLHRGGAGARCGEAPRRPRSPNASSGWPARETPT